MKIAKMKILFVHYLENIGGGERYLVNVVNSLPRKYEVYLLTPNSNSKIESIINRPIVKISRKFKRNLGPFPSFSITLFFSIRDIVQSNNIDVIHINDHYLLPSVFFQKKKVVFTSHGLWDVYFYINRLVLKYLNPSVIAATPIQYFRLKECIQDLHLMPFFNVDKIKSVNHELCCDNINLSIVGRFSPVKNHFYAFDIIDSLGKHFYLNVYGAKTLDIAEEKDSYEVEIINHINNNSNIIHHGFISDMEAIYKNTDILIITSETESFSMVTIEALSYGVPVVSTLTEGSSSLIKDGYNGFICNNKNEFIEKIELIKERYSYYSENAYESSQKYIQELYIEKLLNIYEDR